MTPEFPLMFGRGELVGALVVDAPEVAELNCSCVVMVAEDWGTAIVVGGRETERNTFLHPYDQVSLAGLVC
jgi:hypothetical protein